MTHARCARGSCASVLVIAIALAASSACAARGRGFVPPTTGGEPLADAAAILQQATASCRDVRTLTAEAGLSGRANGERVRGRVHLGIAPDGALRLEGIAPFGQPAFILAARGGTGTLFLPRDRAVLRDASTSEIVETLAGVALTPDDLKAILTGCVTPDLTAREGTRYANDIVSIATADGSTLYLRHTGRRTGTGNGTGTGGGDHYTIAAGQRGDLTIEFGDAAQGRRPRVRLRRGGARPTDLSLELTQVDTNATVPAEAFQIEVPPDTRTVTLDDLRRGAPLAKP